MNELYVALGSNLARPYLQLQRALTALRKIPRSQLLAVSGFYRNAALGTHSQSDYLNAVARMRSALPPHYFLRQLQVIERRQGRRRVAGRRWDPRQLDLDLLLYGNRTINSRTLTVPHPLMTDRDFVVVPLQEVAVKGLYIPAFGSLDALSSGIDPRRLKRVMHVR